MQSCVLNVSIFIDRQQTVFLMVFLRPDRQESNYLDNVVDNNSVFVLWYRLRMSIDAVTSCPCPGYSHNKICLCPDPTYFSVSCKLQAATCNKWQFAPTLL